MAKAPKEAEIQKLMTKLDLTREEAIDLWRCDHDLDTNEEQNALQAAAYKEGNKIKRVNRGPQKAPKKKKEKKVDLAKYTIMRAVTEALQKTFVDPEVTTITEDKKIRFKVGEEYFTLDLVRMTKKTLEKEGLM